MPQWKKVQLSYSAVLKVLPGVVVVPCVYVQGRTAEKRGEDPLGPYVQPKEEQECQLTLFLVLLPAIELLWVQKEKEKEHFYTSEPVQDKPSNQVTLSMQICYSIFS